MKLKIAGLDSGSRFKYRLRFRLKAQAQAQAQAQALGFKSRLRLWVWDPGSGSKLFEPRLGRFRLRPRSRLGLRLKVFEPVDNITHLALFVRKLLSVEYILKLLND